MIPDDSLILELTNEDGAIISPVALLMNAYRSASSHASNWRNCCPVIAGILTA